MKHVNVVQSPIIDRILTGHFCEKIGYGVLRPEGTSDCLLIYTIRGSGSFGDGSTQAHDAGSRIPVGPGDVILMRPATLHDYRVHVPAKRWELLWAHFHPRPEWQRWLDWPAMSSTLPGLMRVSIDNLGERRNVDRALRRMNDLAIGSHPLSRTMAMNALEEAILWCAKQVLRPSDHDARIELAQNYLCQNCRQNVTLRDLADMAGLSVSRFSFLFGRQTGLSPQRYYEVHRLERARQLLEMTTLPVKSIAAQIGFDNPFYFTLRFKRHTGKSPREYRLNLSNVPLRQK